MHSNVELYTCHANLGFFPFFLKDTVDSDQLASDEATLSESTGFFSLLLKVHAYKWNANYGGVKCIKMITKRRVKAQ